MAICLIMNRNTITGYWNLSAPGKNALKQIMENFRPMWGWTERLTVPAGKGVEGWYNWTPELPVSELIDLYL
jgi:hypothetical protein